MIQLEGQVDTGERTEEKLLPFLFLRQFWYVLISSLNCKPVSSLFRLGVRESLDWTRGAILALAFTPEQYPLIEPGRVPVLIEHARIVISSFLSFLFGMNRPPS